MTCFNLSLIRDLDPSLEQRCEDPVNIVGECCECWRCEFQPGCQIAKFIFVVNVGVGVTLCADTSLIIKTRREVFLFLEQKLETETMRCDSASRDPCQPNHNHPPVQIEIISLYLHLLLVTPTYTNQINFSPEIITFQTLFLTFFFTEVTVKLFKTE